MKLLIGYDGSATANDALRGLEKAGLPEKLHARLVFAIPPILPLDALKPDAKTPGWYSRVYKEAMREARSREKAALRSAEDAARWMMQRHPQWRVEAETCAENAAEAILKREAAWKPDLIVMGSHGRNLFGRLVFGSVASKVLAHARGDVRIGRKAANKPSLAPRILIGYDGSRDADHALARVAGRAWPAGTQVRLLAVADFQLRLDEILVSLKKKNGKPTREGRWPWMERKLEKASEKLAKLGLEHSTAIVQGEPRDVILSEAAAFRADAIFLGPRGLSGIERFMLGSVSSGVAAHAHCAVEIIRGKRKAGKA